MVQHIFLRSYTSRSNHNQWKYFFKQKLANAINIKRELELGLWTLGNPFLDLWDVEHIFLVSLDGRVFVQN